MRRSLCLALGLLLAVAASRASAEEGWMFDPAFRVGAADEVLAEGPPALLRAHVDAFVDLLSASFDLAVPAALERKLRDGIETRYEGMDVAARRGYRAITASLGSARASARVGAWADTRDALRDFRMAMDQRLEGASAEDKVGAIVRDILVLRREQHWPSATGGALNGTAAVAWLEMIEFLVSIGRNEDFTPTTGQIEVLRRDLAVALRVATPAERARLQNAHRTWLRLKGRWDARLVPDRVRLRWEAVQLLARAMPPEQRVTTGSSGDLAAYARAAAVVRGAQPGYGAWSNLARHPTAVLEVVDRWLGPGEESASGMVLFR